MANDSEVMSIKSAMTLFVFALFACSDDSSNFSLNGTWVDSESLGIQFISFDSRSEGRVGSLGPYGEQSSEFTYRLLDGKVAIDFKGDARGETIHDLFIDDYNTIRISDFTVVPENPLKTYLRRPIVTQRANDTIVLRANEIYYDTENNFRLEGSIVQDYRCPTGLYCVWQGAVEVRLNLVLHGNDQHIFDLAIGLNKQDTVIQGTTYRLAQVTPHPQRDKEIRPQDYRIKVVVD